MAVTKSLVFMITTLSLFVLIVGGLSGTILNAHNSYTVDMSYFKNNHMTDLMNDTYYTPKVNGNDLHNTPSYKLAVSNMTVGTYAIRIIHQIWMSDGSKAVFSLAGADDVSMWITNNPASSLPGEIYRNVEITIYQNWGIWSEGIFKFNDKSIMASYDQSKGYARLVSSGLAFPFQLTVIPDANTSLQSDLWHNQNYSVFISLSKFDSARATSGAWGMVSKLMTFSMPNWNPIVSMIIGTFIDAYIAITIFLVVRSFIPTLGYFE